MRTFTSSFHKTRKLRFLLTDCIHVQARKHVSYWFCWSTAFHSGTMKIRAPLKSARPYFSCCNTNTWWKNYTKTARSDEFYQMGKKRKTKLWLSQLDYTRVWTQVHVWLLFCCTALHRCSLWLSQFSCLKTWRKTASHFLFQDANSNKQLMMVLPALATLWNTWAIIAIIIRRIVINLQLCDEAIKDTTQDRPSMIHGHTLTVPLLESPRDTCTRVYINIIMTFYTSSYKLTQTQIWPLPLKNIINRWGQDLSLLVFRLKASPGNTFALRTNCCLMMGLNIFMLVWAQNWLWHFILKN